MKILDKLLQLPRLFSPEEKPMHDATILPGGRYVLFLHHPNCYAIEKIWISDWPITMDLVLGPGHIILTKRLEAHTTPLDMRLTPPKAWNFVLSFDNHHTDPVTIEIYGENQQ